MKRAMVCFFSVWVIVMTAASIAYFTTDRVTGAARPGEQRVTNGNDYRPSVYSVKQIMNGIGAVSGQVSQQATRECCASMAPLVIASKAQAERELKKSGILGGVGEDGLIHAITVDEHAKMFAHLDVEELTAIMDIVRWTVDDAFRAENGSFPEGKAHAAVHQIVRSELLQLLQIMQRGQLTIPSDTPCIADGSGCIERTPVTGATTALPYVTGTGNWSHIDTEHAGVWECNYAADSNSKDCNLIGTENLVPSAGTDAK